MKTGKAGQETAKRLWWRAGLFFFALLSAGCAFDEAVTKYGITGLTAMALGGGKAELSWDKVDAADSYGIELVAGPLVSGISITHLDAKTNRDIVSPGIGAVIAYNYCVVSGLRDGQIYTFRVRSVDDSSITGPWAKIQVLIE